MKKLYCLFLYCLSIMALASPHTQQINTILKDVNDYRKVHRLPPLMLKSDLSKEAQKHSQNMAQHRIAFSHAGFTERIQRIYAHTLHPYGAAENIAYNYKDGHDVVRHWLTSRHHLANIKGHYNYTGIGLAFDQHGRLYVTQIFLLASLPRLSS